MCRSVVGDLVGGRSRHLQTPVFDCQRAVWRNDKHPVCVDGHPVLGFDHRHRGNLAQEFGQDALMVWGKVLDEHERHAVVRRHGG